MASKTNAESGDVAIRQYEARQNATFCAVPCMGVTV